MRGKRLVTGLAAAFGLMTATFVVGGLAYSPALFIMALVFGVITYVLYSHASGRLLNRVYRGVERQAASGTGTRTRGRAGGDAGRGGFGAGPREEWTPPGAEQRRRARQRARQEGWRGQRAAGGRRGAGGVPNDGPTPREAYGVLGLDPGADRTAVRQAYRERIKEVHPDTDGGSEEEFKRVREAYEVLTE